MVNEPHTQILSEDPTGASSLGVCFTFGPGFFFPRFLLSADPTSLTNSSLPQGRPTLVVQVHDDSITYPSDVQAIYDNIPVKDKRLFWIEGTTRRLDGYNYLGEHPYIMIDWFDEHMGEEELALEGVA
jgi:hypothetical protein